MDNQIITIDNIQYKQYAENQNYYVSKYGVVYSKFSKRFLKGDKSKDGHIRVDVYISGKQKHIFVHQMVYETWVGKYDKSKYVMRHLNDIPWDNRLENLTIGTQQENIQDSIRNGNFGQNSSKTLIILDKTTGKQYEFTPCLDFFKTFTEYKKPQNDSIKRIFTRNWFNKRFKVISFDFKNRM